MRALEVAGASNRRWAVELRGRLVGFFGLLLRQTANLVQIQMSGQESLLHLHWEVGAPPKSTRRYETHIFRAPHEKL